MKAVILLAAMMVLSSCQKDETISSQSSPQDLWVLTKISDAPAPAQVTIQFPEPGKITGQGPCNRYSATQSAPLPWFEAGRIQTTKLACPASAFETTYLAALGKMTLIERLGNTLLLTSDSESLEFRLQ